MTLVFAYGTLRDPARLAHLMGRGFSDTAMANRYVGSATVEDHVVVEGTNGYLTVMPLEGGLAEGLLIELEGSELTAVDYFEGVNAGFYERATLLLSDGREALYWRQTEEYAPRLVGGVYKPPPRR